MRDPQIEWLDLRLKKLENDPADLRDRFAMAVAQAVHARAMVAWDNPTNELIAECAYDLADALMAERARRRKEVPDAERP